jgi:hypothetical protein
MADRKMETSNILVLVLMILVSLAWWIDASWKASMKRGYENVVLAHDFKLSRIYMIERFNFSNKIYTLSWGGGLSYRCFAYEKGFDEYVRTGDFLSKNRGELKVTVTKPNKEERVFTFEITSCEGTEKMKRKGIYIE